MAEAILPKLGFTTDEGTVVEWLVADGAHVRAGEPSFLLETDKSATEIEAPATGTLMRTVRTGTLDDFRAEARAWLEANCPEELRAPFSSDQEMPWGGKTLMSMTIPTE